MKFSKAIYLATVLSTCVAAKNIRSGDSVRDVEEKKQEHRRELGQLLNRDGNRDGKLLNGRIGDGKILDGRIGDGKVGNGRIGDLLKDTKVLGGNGIFVDDEKSNVSDMDLMKVEGDPAVPHLTSPVTKAASEDPPEIYVEVNSVGLDGLKGLKPKILDGNRISIFAKPLSLRFHNMRQAMQHIKIEPGMLQKYRDNKRLSIEGYAPRFLDIVTEPLTVTRPAVLPEDGAGQKVGTPLSVIEGDNRTIFEPNGYPWTTVGKVVTDWGICTGTLVGRNLILTASHCVTEYADGQMGGLTFTPAYYDGEAPFGVAKGKLVLRNNNVDPTNGLTYIEVANDYAVVVLDRNIGDFAGYMGIHKYRTEWNGREVWYNLGYPCDLTGSEKPIWSAQNKIVSTKDPNVTPNNLVLVTNTDTYVGQSGGPIFGWWKAIDNTWWPQIIGDVSAEWVGENYASGGVGLEELVLLARNEYESND